MVVALRLLGVTATSWAAEHIPATVVVDTAITHLEAPIADCTALDIEGFAVVAASPSSTAHID